MLEASLKRYTAEKASVYCFQDDLLKYLVSKNSYFQIQPLKPQTKTSKLFAIGIEYLKDCYESNSLKKETLLLAVFLWHNVNTRAALTPEETVKYLNPCLWLASKNEEYFPLASYKLTVWLNVFRPFQKSDYYQTQTTDDLVDYEQRLLELQSFMIFVPPLHSLVELIKAQVLNEFGPSSTITARSLELLEGNYHKIDLFSTFNCSLLALAALTFAYRELERECILTSSGDFIVLGFSKQQIFSCLAFLKKGMKSVPKKICLVL